jgi:uncharacterized protein (TIGR02145 family)
MINLLKPGVVFLIVLLWFSACKEEDNIEANRVITVSITDVKDIENWSAVVTVAMTDNTNSYILRRGICYGFSPDPTFENSFISDNSGDEVFDVKLSNLKRDTTYYVRAVVENPTGIVYSEQTSFTTTNESSGVFIDTRDNNEYSWVQIGDQIWMVENLAYLPEVNAPDDISDSIGDTRYYVYGYDGVEVDSAKSHLNYITHGVLYNWYAAKNAAPNGWHLPTDDEWKKLEMYLGMSEEDANIEENASNECDRGTNEALKLKSITEWSNSSLVSTDEVGFNALPSGELSPDAGFNGIDITTSWWTSTEAEGKEGDYIYDRSLFLSSPQVHRSSLFNDHRFGYSVRCVKDNVN